MVATLAGGYLALVSFRQDRSLSVGTIRLSVSPGHKGALDIYVPLVDWGARFEAIRLPARLRIDLKTVDRDVIKKVAAGGALDVQTVRKDARDAIATYLRNLIMLVFLCGGSLGILVAFAVRGGATPKLRYTTGAAVATATLSAVALVTLLPPRGAIDEPQYYAFGPDIPKALEAVETAQRSTKALDQELDAQLVGLARLVNAPANRPALEDRPRLTVASDLHNNVFDLPILERTAAKGPVFFVGDLTDRGSPLEAALVRRVVRVGKPFVFVPGNHDSDSLARQLARRRSGRADPHRPAEQERRDHRRPRDHHRRRPRSRRLRRPLRAPGRRQLRRPLQPHPGPGGSRALRDLDARRPRRRGHRDGPQPRAPRHGSQRSSTPTRHPSRSRSSSATPTRRS